MYGWIYAILAFAIAFTTSVNWVKVDQLEVVWLSQDGDLFAYSAYTK